MTTKFEISRKIGPPAELKERCTTQWLHCFRDASARAFAAVVYLQTMTSNGVHANIIFAKSTVAPLKELTIPRLELVAVVTGSRLLKFVEAQLRIPIVGKILWSDSQCVLHWINKDQVSTTFEDNRIREIKQLKDVQFRYVPTAEYPADLPSRGCDFGRLSQSKLWWNGPQWLQKKQEKWPEIQINYATDKREKIISPVCSDLTLLVSDNSTETNILEINKFSSLLRLLRVTAYVQRFIHNSRRILKFCGFLKAAEIGQAKAFWIKKVQEDHLLEVKGQIRSKRMTGIVRQLNPSLDSDGIIRCKGRYDYAELSEQTKCPVLLPKKCHFSDLVIMDCHSRILHAGVDQTLAQARYEYWIIHARSQVKKVLNECQYCQKIEGGPYGNPPFPNLPEFRVKEAPPFNTVGLDYLGPLWIKTGNNMQKVWICLFTCAVVRAIHLEVISDLSTEQFLLCLRRFIATYGMPTLIISDNAKQFHKANKVLNTLWQEIRESTQVQDFSSSLGIQWKFITELAPWMGGFYERMVGLVKRALKKSLDGKRVTITELQTVVTEITAVVNSRPLVYSEAEVGPIPLTPAHFLAKSSREGIPCLPKAESRDPPDDTQGTASLILKWKRSQALLGSFWSIWLNSYLLSLRTKPSQVSSRNASSLDPTIGSIVVIKQDLMPRGQWKVGRISDLRVSLDGRCRSAVIKLPSGKSVRRPLRLLYPIEVGQDPSTKSDDVKKSNNPQKKSIRAAAIKAAGKIRKIIADDENSSDSENE